VNLGQEASLKKNDCGARVFAQAQVLKSIDAIVKEDTNGKRR
jgi:hypothetical protein